jgi:hypothetical protein
VNKRTIWIIPIVLILATAHSPAFLYGFGLGKYAGYYDIMNDVAAACPGITGPKTEIKSSQY